jgi:hypothetical protein
MPFVKKMSAPLRVEAQAALPAPIAHLVAM